MVETVPFHDVEIYQLEAFDYFPTTKYHRIVKILTLVLAWVLTLNHKTS